MRLIDADELAKRIKEEGNHQYYALCNTEATHNYADCYSKVLSAPTIEERKTGKWINRRKCSECGYVDVVSPYAHNVNTGEVTLVYKFCPNCGARMEVGNDE